MRFWTAAWVAVYSAFRIFRNHDRRYFLLALATPFFHRAYWIFIIITIISYILRNRNRVLIFLFFISFIVSRNSVSFFQKLSNSLPPIWSQAVLNYANEEYIQLRNQPGSGFYWLGNVFRYLEEYYIYLLIFLLIINANKISKDDRTSNIFCFLLVLMTFVNISMPIPSLGGRFLTLAYPIVAYIWLVHFKGRKYTQILYMMPFVFSFSILYLVAKEYPKVTDIWLYCANPFYLLYRYLFL